VDAVGLGDREGRGVERCDALRSDGSTHAIGKGQLRGPYPQELARFSHKLSDRGDLRGQLFFRGHALGIVGPQAHQNHRGLKASDRRLKVRPSLTEPMGHRGTRLGERLELAAGLARDLAKRRREADRQAVAEQKDPVPRLDRGLAADRAGSVGQGVHRADTGKNEHAAEKPGGWGSVIHGQIVPWFVRLAQPRPVAAAGRG